MREIYDDNVFFMFYILLERLKEPKDRRFHAYFEIWPEDCEGFPLFFTEDESYYLTGSPLKDFHTTDKYKEIFKGIENGDLF